jgi:ubiquinone/menaquinone biosynthesis C-methylase UbiE
MIPRVPEPEVMDSPAEAEAYDAMDHATVNEAFARAALALAPRGGRVLDLGTGTARVPLCLLELYQRASTPCSIVAVDAAPSMLEVARRNVERAGASAAISLCGADAKALDFPDGSFDLVLSKSLVHHLPDPRPTLREVARLAGPGGAILIRDLFRPHSDEALEAKVREVCAHESAAATALFRASLWAAFTVGEIEAMACESGLSDARVYASSDRHWTIERRRAVST